MRLIELLNEYNKEFGIKYVVVKSIKPCMIKLYKNYKYELYKCNIKDNTKELVYTLIENIIENDIERFEDKFESNIFRLLCVKNKK